MFKRKKYIPVFFFISFCKGGVSQCCNRYAKANNKFMGSEFNPQEEIKYLSYLDANNLYGWAMSQYLPYEAFEWVENIDEDPMFFNVPENSDVGFILEVDIEYPDSLHFDHQDLPLCPERMKPPGSKQEKLLTTLYDKEKYVIHYIALKQALKYGLKLKKIHRALKFNQSPWLKQYIDLNTRLRQEATNEFEKNNYKLKNNAIYGKTLENTRKHVDVKLLQRWENRYGVEDYISKPNFHNLTIFDENFVAVQLERTEVKMDKPIYIGLSVLDLSKTLMYRFHYEFMKPKIGENLKLLYMDTDSFIYEITDFNIYEIMRDNIHEFDTSDLRENNQFGLPRANKKVLGLMKVCTPSNILYIKS